MQTTWRTLVVTLGAAGTLTLAACGGTSSTPSAGASGAAATSAPTANAPTTTAAAAPAKVSANNASRAELQRAFEAAGIPNAARIAGEVEEYRPYPTDDASFAKLRQELAKYNIPTDVVSQVIATLEL